MRPPHRLVTLLLGSSLVVGGTLGALGPLDASGARAGNEDARSRQRRQLVDHLTERGIRDPAVLDALREVPRHRFVPKEMRPRAYEDTALPIGEGQTISQPFVVATMTEALELRPAHRVFELGTGSGYQAAVASRIVDEVYTVEIVPALAARADALLDSLGYDNVHVRAGDGWRGWPEAAPFDRILVTAAAPEMPMDLLAQLAPGGRMILPLGPAGGTQRLILVEKREDGSTHTEDLFPVRFVPVTGDH